MIESNQTYHKQSVFPSTPPIRQHYLPHSYIRPYPPIQHFPTVSCGPPVFERDLRLIKRGKPILKPAIAHNCNGKLDKIVFIALWTLNCRQTYTDYFSNHKPFAYCLMFYSITILLYCRSAGPIRVGNRIPIFHQDEAASQHQNCG